MYLASPEEETEEIENAKWRVVKRFLTHCPDEIRFDDFLRLFGVVENKPKLRRFITLRFRVTNTFGKRKWIDLAIDVCDQKEGWEFNLTGIVVETPRHKAICGIHRGMTFRITGYSPVHKTAASFEVLRSQE